ncbi:PD-(D/E)XK nuclease family transposase [bacterium]|nr:PD-(D/E)XK nuclease family transposase [bacterium]
MRHPTLLNDILFKIVFGTQQNEAILRALVNALLGYSGLDRITRVDILNPFNEKDYYDQRGLCWTFGPKTLGDDFTTSKSKLSGKTAM